MNLQNITAASFMKLESPLNDNFSLCLQTSCLAFSIFIFFSLEGKLSPTIPWHVLVRITQSLLHLKVYELSRANKNTKYHV